MNKKLGVIIVIIVLLLGGGAYVMMSRSKTAPAPAMMAKPTETATTVSQVKGTLKGLLTSALPQTCTFTGDNGATGSVYVSGGKMRGDFQEMNQGKTFSGHMIIDSGYTYFWSDAMTRGMKMALSEVQTTTTPAAGQGVDVNQSVSYSCKPWVPDASMFALPANVTFTTFTMPTGAMTTGAMTPPSAGAPANACAACDNLPAGPAQTACKTQLKCP